MRAAGIPVTVVAETADTLKLYVVRLPERGAVDAARLVREFGRVLDEAGDRFVALNAEEVGLQGAEAFAARHRERGTPYDAAFNVDAVGTANGARRLVINADAPSAWIQALIAETHDAYGFALNLELKQNPIIVADDTPLSLAGIPTVMVASMLDGDPLIQPVERHDRRGGPCLRHGRGRAPAPVCRAARLALSPADDRQRYRVGNGPRHRPCYPCPHRQPVVGKC